MVGGWGCMGVLTVCPVCLVTGMHGTGLPYKKAATNKAKHARKMFKNCARRRSQTFYQQEVSIKRCDLFRPDLAQESQDLSHHTPSLNSRDVIISGQICGSRSKLQRVFTVGDGCWPPIFPGFSNIFRHLVMALFLRAVQ